MRDEFDSANNTPMNNGNEKQANLAELYGGVFGGDAWKRLAEAQEQAARADKKLDVLGADFATRIANLRRDSEALAGRLAAARKRALALADRTDAELIEEHATLRAERIEGQQQALETMTDDLDVLATGLADEIRGLFAEESGMPSPSGGTASLAQALLVALPHLRHARTLTDACADLDDWLGTKFPPRESLHRLRQFKACCDLMAFLDEQGLERLQDIAAQRDEEAAVLGSHLESHESVARRLENDLFFLEQGKVP